MSDLLRAQLARREWVVTIEAVTPRPDDSDARARILALADAIGGDDRVAALTLTDRTLDAAADPVALAPHVATRSGKPPLVHLAGKARAPAEVERTVRRAAETGVTSVLLTGGDTPPGVAGVDALDMLSLARTVAPELLRVGVLAGAPGDAAGPRAAAKRAAGAEAFVAQVSWDLAQREAIAGAHARIGVPVMGAAIALTRRTLGFLDAHGFGTLGVAPPLRARVGRQSIDDAVLRLALDLILLRRLGYAGVHVSGLVTPALVTRVLDEADRLDRTLGDDWRDVWRDAMGLA